MFKKVFKETKRIITKNARMKESLIIREHAYKNQWENIICTHYTEKQVKCLTSNKECYCDLGLKCPKEFQCPQYETTSGNRKTIQI